MKFEHDHIDPYRCYLYGPTPEGCGSRLGHEPIEALKASYGDTEADRVLEELDRLLDRFKTPWLPATAHASPSPTWRDESLADVRHSKLSRFVTRVHVFEQSAAASEREAEDGRGAGGRYLGFVCLRPAGSVDRDQVRTPYLGFRYVIEAELVRPRHMSRPRYHLIQTTASAPRMGVLPFVSTVFMAPRQGVESSTCVHLAVSQALHLVMGRFGCKPISQREFEVHLWQQKQPISIDQVAKKGASLQDALSVVSQNCGGGGYIAEISQLDGKMSREEVLREAHRVLTDTLANGLPVIMMVDHQNLHPKYRSEPHAALIFGMRLLHSGHELTPQDKATTRRGTGEDCSELPGIFIGHDSIKGPYVEWTAKQLLEAALGCPPNDLSNLPGVRFLALGPQGFNMGLDTARRLAREMAFWYSRLKRELFERYYRAFADERTFSAEFSNDPRHWRYVTRMVSWQEVVRKYMPEVPEQRPRGRARRKARLRRLDQCFPAPNELNQASDPTNWQAGYCWAVELLLPVYRDPTPGTEPTNQPLLVFLWRISDSGAGPRTLLVRQRDGTYEPSHL